MPKPIKLSPAQKRVVDKMRKGYELIAAKDVRGRWYLVHPNRPLGGFRIHWATFEALCNRYVIGDVVDGFAYLNESALTNNTSEDE